MVVYVVYRTFFWKTFPDHVFRNKEQERKPPTAEI